MCSLVQVNGQEHSIHIDAQLDDTKDIIRINQRIIFYNDSDTTLTHIYLHNWANGYKNNKAPLAKRLIEDYDKSLYFANQKDRGFTTIKNLNVDYETATFSDVEDDKIDVIKIVLNTPLSSKKSTTINVAYDVKIPSAKFTRYGKTKTGYHLRYWYLVPAVFKDDWKVM